MNGVISPDNIKRIGELVTLYSLRTVCHYEKRTFSSLYKSLLRDMFRSADPENLYPTHTTSCRRLYVFSANISAKACTTSTKRIRTASR